MSGNRESRRLKNLEAEGPPPLRVAKKGSRLKTLLGREFHHGKVVECDPAIAWKLDEMSPMNLSFLEQTYQEAEDEDLDDSTYNSADNSVEDDGKEGSSVARELLFDVNKEFSDDDEDEEDAEEEQAPMKGLPELNSGSKLIPFPDLKSLIESNCVCQQCAEKGHVSHLVLTEETYGIATNLQLICHPCDCRNAQHIKTLEAARLDEEGRPAAGRYFINYVLMVAMQMLGLSIDTLAVMLALLGMRMSLGNKQCWRKIQDRLGEAEQIVKGEVLLQNVEKEIEATIKADPS